MLRAPEPMPRIAPLFALGVLVALGFGTARADGPSPDRQGGPGPGHPDPVSDFKEQNRPIDRQGGPGPGHPDRPEPSSMVTAGGAMSGPGPGMDVAGSVYGGAGVDWRVDSNLVAGLGFSFTQSVPVASAQARQVIAMSLLVAVDRATPKARHLAEGGRK